MSMGPQVERLLHGLVLSWVQSIPKSSSGAQPDRTATLVCDVLMSAVETAVLLLSLNVHGPKCLHTPAFQQREGIQHSVLLAQLVAKTADHSALARRHLLPPAPIDSQHLQEWLQVADYAATALVTMSSVLGLEVDLPGQ
jgi:hypothetical protein